MPTPSTSSLPPPKSWDEFEEICADLFSREWRDPNATRYGRQGQRQNGVDIYGTPASGEIAGVQCKGRRAWPPPPLKTTDLDEEIAKAKNFTPALSTLTIATTAPDDGKIQDHARAITEDHRSQGLFAVYVVGWGELTRRLTQHGDLIEKHYGFVSLASLRKDIQESSTATAELVVARLKSEREAKGIADVSERLLKRIRPLPVVVAAQNTEESQTGLQDAAERDLAQRYRAAYRRHLFPEAGATDEFGALGAELLAGNYAGAVSHLRRRILLRAARSAAVHRNIPDAERFLAAAQALEGDEPDVMARARIADARDNVDEAIRLLRDRKDSESLSVLLSILDRRRGKDKALEWWRAQGLLVSDLTAIGSHTLAVLHIRGEEFEDAREILDALSERQMEEAPGLLLLRAGVRLACTMSKPERPGALAGLLVDIRRFRPMLSDEALSVELDKAVADLNRVLPVTSELGLKSTQRIARAYLLWCELLHPARRQAAIDTLRREMAVEHPPLEKLPFVFAFVPAFDPAPVRRYIEQREKFGGLEDDELFALLVLHLHDRNARSTVDFIARYRARLGGYVNPQGLLSLEIQALAKAGDAAAARRLFDERRAELDPTMIATIEAEVANAEGADPVETYQRAYAAANTPDNLRALIGAFEDRGDHRSAAEYSQQLYRKTNHPADITFAATALARAGELEAFVAMIDAHSFVLDRSNEVAVQYGWQLFRLGRLREARSIADRLIAKGIDERDLNLEIALAIESGDWEAVARPLEVFRANHERFSAEDLMRAANLAWATGQSAPKELLHTAVEKAPDDPRILVNAYSMAIEDGSEDTPETQNWFRRAVELSGPDGPVQPFELKELLPKQREWNEHTRKINQHVVRGEIPLSIAAAGLRTSHLDIVLRNLIRNEGLADARKRAALPLFSGRRKITTIGECNRAGFDASALLVLGWLDLLSAAFTAFQEIVIPAGTLQELFEGRNRIRHFQRSRLVAAAQIRDAILHKGLKRLPTSVPLHDPLAQEVGNELASLLHTAEKRDGVVLCPAPVHRIGLDKEGDADLSSHASRLADMHALLAILSEENAIDGATEATAQRYFALQDKKWPSSAKPDRKRPLLIDGLALTYLQTTGLLDAVLRTFTEVLIDTSTGDEATTLLDYDLQVEEVSTVVDRIRRAVRDAHTAGKLMFAPRRSGEDAEDGDRHSSTLNLLSDLLKCDVVLFDDRMLNGEGFATDQSGHRARTATSLDLIEELFKREAVTAEARRRYRHRLRRGGAVLIPVDADEIEYAAARNRKAESPEFRAIRDSIDLARIAEMPRFPAEIPWFASLCIETKHAILRVWQNHPDRAAEISNSILALRPKPEDWVPRWEGAVPPNWAEAIHCMLAFGLTLPIELTDKDVIAKYNTWLEDQVLHPLRDLKPSRIEGIVAPLRDLIIRLAEDVPDEP